MYYHITIDRRLYTHFRDRYYKKREIDLQRKNHLM